MSNALDKSVEGVLRADKRVPDLHAQDERSEKMGVGSSKAGVRASLAEKHKFVTEWSYCPDDEDAVDNSLNWSGNNVHNCAYQLWIS